MAPANLTMLEDGQNNDGEDSRLRPKISWVAPPSSDLPLKDYQVDSAICIKFIAREFSYPGGKQHKSLLMLMNWTKKH